jgi:hypothetical protein
MVAPQKDTSGKAWSMFPKSAQRFLDKNMLGQKLESAVQR